jgi:predicted nucleic acid-binding Zn ribbon protein
MKPIDKFGDTIYPYVFKKLCVVGNQLESLGYFETKGNPNLFMRRTRQKLGGVDYEIWHYADMRGTKDVRIWQDPVPLIYLFPKRDSGIRLPEWVRNRCLILEMERLEAEDVPHRLSWRSYATDSDDHRHIENGFCKICGTDFQTSGLWCSEVCEEQFDRQKRKEFAGYLLSRTSEDHKCEVCGLVLVPWWSNDAIESVNELLEEQGRLPVRRVVEHHTSYELDETVFVCTSCHGRIHHTDDKELAPLRPKDSRTKRRVYKLVPCENCDEHKAQVGFDSPESSGICYKCRKKLESQTRPKKRGRRSRHYLSDGYYNPDSAIGDKFG